MVKKQKSRIKSSNKEDVIQHCLLASLVILTLTNLLVAVFLSLQGTSSDRQVLLFRDCCRNSTIGFFTIVALLIGRKAFRLFLEKYGKFL